MTDASISKNLLGTIIVVLLGIGAVWYFATYKIPISSPTPSTSNALINTINYVCNDDKTITALFYQGSTPSVSPGQPPMPGGSVQVTLSDGRTMTLPQTISADGVRYSNSDGSFIFWSKGNGALVLENNQQQTYVGCIAVVPDPGGLPNAYENSSDEISIRYPTNYTPDDTYTYQELGPGKDISGVKFTIDPAIASGTNLSTDSYISVEEIPQTASCSANLFLDGAPAAQSVTEGSTTYSVATMTGAGAGNRYEETVYAISGTNPCVAVRYMIHYAVLDNYPTGTVTAFDEASLKAQFDAIRQTLTLNQ